MVTRSKTITTVFTVSSHGLFKDPTDYTLITAGESAVSFPAKLDAPVVGRHTDSDGDGNLDVVKLYSRPRPPVEQKT
jgi:hypothetical protein